MRPQFWAYWGDFEPNTGDLEIENLRAARAAENARVRALVYALSTPAQRLTHDMKRWLQFRENRG